MAVEKNDPAPIGATGNSDNRGSKNVEKRDKGMRELAQIAPGVGNLIFQFCHFIPKLLSFCRHFLRRRTSVTSEGLNFARDNGKSLTVISSARGLGGRVQLQEVRLAGNFFSLLGDSANVLKLGEKVF